MNYRNLVLGLDIRIPISNGKEVIPINFDNAATTPPFKYVLSKVNEFSHLYSSIHRGTGFKSRYSSRLFEEAREVICDFVNAHPHKDTVIFLKNASEALNKISYRLKPMKGRDVILSTAMEHHSNDLPWREKFTVDYIDIDKNGRLSMEDFKSKLAKYKDRVRLVTVTGASNVTGYMNPIYEMAELAHDNGAEILMDAAQLIPHGPINMRPDNPKRAIDYLVFSAHKMYAPFGIGVLIGPKKNFENSAPEYCGGGTIDIVTHEKVIWAEPPHKEEAGSPNVIGVVALVASIKILNSLGMNNILNHEKSLTQYTMEKIKNIPGITVYGDTLRLEDKLGIITFNMEDIYHETLANILSYEAGIAVRNGCFCAQPYIFKLLGISNTEIENNIKNPSFLRPGMVRISFGLYNTKEEVDVLIRLLKKISSNKNYFVNKYEGCNWGSL